MTMNRRRKLLKAIGYTFLSLLVLLNVMCCFHTYKLTHFAEATGSRSKRIERMSTAEKVKAIFFGVSNPKPTNRSTPSKPYNTFHIDSNVKLECWEIAVPKSKGTVALFHGFGASKSSMVNVAERFVEMGYTILLVDFMGSGGSEGNNTTIGYEEAINVRDVFDYLSERGDKNILLYGCSMGSVAIMKAVAELQIHPSKIMLECPFATMSDAVGVRIAAIRAPQYPFRPLLMFWGGVINRFNAFGHNPEDYAKNIQVPTLVLYGKRDPRVSMDETQRIYDNLPLPTKQLTVFHDGWHGKFVERCLNEWQQGVKQFLSQN